MKPIFIKLTQYDVRARKSANRPIWVNVDRIVQIQQIDRSGDLWTVLEYPCICTDGDRMAAQSFCETPEEILRLIEEARS